MNRSIIILLFGLSILLMSMSAEAASRGIVIDQMQPLVDDSVGGLFIGGTSEQELAQTVTVGLDSDLLGIYLPIGCESCQLIIEIRELIGDEPGNIVLRRRMITAANASPIGPVFRFFQIGGSLSFVAGDRFAVVLLNPKGSCGIYRSPTGDSYVGGEGFFQALPNLPGWVPFSATETQLDLPFIIDMRLP